MDEEMEQMVLSTLVYLRINFLVPQSCKHSTDSSRRGRQSGKQSPA